MTPHKKKAGRDHWCTSQMIVDALLQVWPARGKRPAGPHIDPCSNPWSIVPAQWRIMLPEHRNGLPECSGILVGDGLRFKWTERIYCNPPFSDPKPWTAKMREAGADRENEVIGCVRCDPSVAWFQDIWTADAICFTDHRHMFIPPPGVTPSSNNGANALPYWGAYPDRFEQAFAKLGKIIFPGAARP